MLVCFSMLWLQLGVMDVAGQSPQFVPISAELLAQLEDALAERNTDLDARMELVQTLDKLVPTAADNHSAHAEVMYKIRFLEALTNMRLNNLDLSSTQLEALRARVDADRFPELAFRCRSLHAAILLLQGHKTESLVALEELLAGDLRSVSTHLVARARINHACALQECGRLNEAIERFQAIMLTAIEDRQDSAALQAGNSMLQILLDGDNARAARQALQELEPVMARNPETMGTQAVRMRENSLLLLEGETETAIQRLQEFIDRPQPAPRQLLGTAHRLMAQAQAVRGQLDDALKHARRAVALHEKANIGFDSRITLAEILLQRKEYDEALHEVQAIDLDTDAAPATKKRVYRVKLEAQLLKAGHLDEAELVMDTLDAVEASDKYLTDAIANDFERQLAMVRKTLSEQKAAVAEQVSRETDRAERYRRYILFGILVIAVSGGGVVASLNWRRRQERLKLAEQTAQTARLEALVESKTRELKANLEAQAEMARALERKKRMETVGLLAGNVAHDINNLLQVIANANETLASPDASEQLRSQALSVSDESLRHGSGIIRQILAYSRQQELSARPVNVHEYLCNSRALFHSAVGAKVELTIDDQSQGKTIRVDPSHLTTSILNLLGNAADAMPAGGQVKIRVTTHKLEPSEPSPWTSLPAGDYLLLCIEDNGTGMSEETKTRAFEPFYSTKNVGEGTGLGLSSVQGFVKQSGGDVRLISTQGVGTQVQILLPLVANPIEASNSSTSSQGSPFAHKRLLLVEDHQAVARSLMILLTHLKLRANWVASGDEAAAMLEQDAAYDFVLSDVHMPGSMDGLQLARWVREKHPSIRVFLMSGYNDLPVDKIDVPLLHKPFKMNELSELLSQASC